MRNADDQDDLAVCRINDLEHRPARQWMNWLIVPLGT